MLKKFNKAMNKIQNFVNGNQWGEAVELIPDAKVVLPVLSLQKRAQDQDTCVETWTR